LTRKYLTTEQAAERLNALAYLERACAHLSAGWIVKTPELEVKIAWGQDLAADLEHASRLYERAHTLRAGNDAEVCVPANWRDHARAIDASSDTPGVLRGLVHIKQYLTALYDEYLDRADPVADAASIQTVEAARGAAQAQVKWMSRRVGAVRARALVPRTSRDAARAGASAPLLPKPHGLEIPFAQGVWAPLDRVPHVARPAWMKRGEPGALRVLPIHPRKDTGLFLHNLLNEEFTTLELVARNSYEHPEMPWAFHRDAARHAGDEARHAQLFLRALPDYGVRYGDYPIYTYSYEGEYEFAPCPPGSSRELLWRLILRQVIHEGLALDSTPFEVQKRRYLKQPELARLFGYTLADEVFHAGAGLKWAHYLVNGDEAAFQREYAEAYTFYQERLKDRRLTWGASHLAAAAAEAEQLDKLARHHHFPFRIEVNVAARRRAGFSEADIQRASEESE
jgi:uncharacterized ferritin-like protein (DUF455 family)